MSLRCCVFVWSFVLWCCVMPTGQVAQTWHRSGPPLAAPCPCQPLLSHRVTTQNKYHQMTLLSDSQVWAQLPGVCQLCFHVIYIHMARALLSSQTSVLPNSRVGHWAKSTAPLSPLCYHGHTEHQKAFCISHPPFSYVNADTVKLIILFFLFYWPPNSCLKRILSQT